MRYLVTAVRGSNDLLTVEVEAADESSLKDHTDLRGCTILAIKPQQFSLPRFKGSTKFPVLLFSRELLTLLKAGLSLTEVIDLLVEKEQNPTNRKLLESLRTSLYQGKSLSSALQAFPNVFFRILCGNDQRQRTYGQPDRIAGSIRALSGTD